MSGRPSTFEVRTEWPQRVARAAREREASLGHAAGPGHGAVPGHAAAGCVFVAGALAERVPEVARALAAECTGTWLVGSGAGVLTERGELEGQSAAAGLLLPKTRCDVVLADKDLCRFGESLGALLSRHPSASALTLLRADRAEDDALVGLPAGAAARVFGGGTLPGRDVFVVQGGSHRAAPAAALVLQGLAPPRVAASPACRLLGPLSAVTEARGGMLLQLGGEPALEVLSASAQNLDDQPLVLLAVAGPSEAAPEPGQSPPLFLRPIQGVDPSRQGVLVGEGLPPGARVAFAVRDARAARHNLEAHLGQLTRACGGAAPRFGIYVNCAGRGAGLYGVADADVRQLRARFPDMPLIGLHSAFELSPFGGGVALQLYAGVLALYSAPS